MESYPGKAHQTACYLLEIPAEIRFIIYKNLVPRQLERFLDLRLRPLSNPRPCLSINRQLICLYLICKQIYTELQQIYPRDSLILRLRPPLSWSQLPGPDPLIFIGREPLQDYFREVVGRLLSSEDDAKMYLDFLRPNEDNGEVISVSETHASRARFPEPADAYEYPHPQFGLILTALSVFKPVKAMFQRVQRLEITDELLGERYPYLIFSWIDHVFPSLRCLNIIRWNEIYMYDSSVTWTSIVIDFWKFDPQDDLNDWESKAESLLKRGIETLWTGRCSYSIGCRDPQQIGPAIESEEVTHDVSFSYNLNCQKSEITALQLHYKPEECVCEFEQRFSSDLILALGREGLKIKQTLVDDFILCLLGKRQFLDLRTDAGWDRADMACPVFDPCGLTDYEPIYPV